MVSVSQAKGRTIWALAALAGAAFLTACTPDDRASATSDDPCGAGALQDHIGQKLDRLPAEIAARARILGPNDPMTRDMRVDRLNILHDEAQVITKIHCG